MMMIIMTSIITTHQSIQTEALEGPKEGIILRCGWFSGSGGLLYVEERVKIITSVY